MVKQFFRLMENALQMVLYRTFLKMVLYGTKKGSAIVTMPGLLQQKKPFWCSIELFSERFYTELSTAHLRTFSINLKNHFMMQRTFNHAKGSMRVHGSIQRCGSIRKVVKTIQMTKGSSHQERVLQLDGECAVEGFLKRVLYSTKKGSSIVTSLTL